VNPWEPLPPGSERAACKGFECALREGKPKAAKGSDWRWVKKQALEEFAFSKADREVMKKVLS